MSDGDPRRAAFERHDAYRADGEGFRIETVSFDAKVCVPSDANATGSSDANATLDAGETSERAEPTYRLTMRVPTLDAAVEESVGPAVGSGWFETLALRLEDAPGAVRDSVDLLDLQVSEDPARGEVVATFEYVVSSRRRAPAVGKAFAEYTEGTYMEGIVPGYTYRGRVAELLSRARQGEDGDSGPMPL